MSGEPDAKRSTMSALEQLKEMTVIVADTGDFEGEFVVNYLRVRVPLSSRPKIRFQLEKFPETLI